MVFLLSSDVQPDGKAALGKYGVRLMSIWWSNALNIRTESGDFGNFFACHYNDGFITECNRDYELIIVKHDTRDESIHGKGGGMI